MSLGDIGAATIRIRPNMAGFSSDLASGATHAISGIWGELGDSMADAGKKLLTTFAPVSYTHLTLPTTPYV